MPAGGATPTGDGTTGFQWWPTAFHYFVMPDSVKEALRSDGTLFSVIHDADISRGALLTSNGLPAYPIVISLASEAVDDSEIAALTNYVAAGGRLFVGSSAFTRGTNGGSRGDFALASAMGIHSATPGLTNWVANQTFTKLIAHSLVAHIPGGVLNWNLPAAADEVSWGVSPDHNLSVGHPLWQVEAAGAVVVAQADNSPYLLIRPYGKGCFIYLAAMEPLLCHGGNAPGMYAYGIFRNAIQAAFAANGLPIPKLSPWPFPYDAALSVRHDFGTMQDQIDDIASSAEFEYTNGAAGDYFFCTGTLRVDMNNSAATIAELQQAVTNYGATLGPQNGGLPNPGNPVAPGDYWYWGSDEVLDLIGTNVPGGYADGAAYALASMSNAVADINSWLPGGNNGPLITAAPYYNATREASLQIEEQLGVAATGEQKLGPFPARALSTSLQTPDMRYPFISLPLSDWFVSTPNVAESLEDGFGDETMQQLVDFYYNWGGLINLHSRSSSAGEGSAGTLASDYVTYGVSKPRIWPANAASIYSWWQRRPQASISAICTNNGPRCFTVFSNSGATDPATAVELLTAGPSVSGVEVFTNGVGAGPAEWRTNGPVLKILVGTAVTNVVVSYLPNPGLQNTLFTVAENHSLLVPSPGVLTNAFRGSGTNLSALLVAGPANGSLVLSNDGSFVYTPQSNYTGIDSFLYAAGNDLSTSAVATATIDVTPPGCLFFDNFQRSANADPLAPWQPVLGQWTLGADQFQGTASDVGTENDAYVAGDWTNYTVQSWTEFSPEALGGGLDGRVNPLSGAKYTLDIFPNGILNQIGVPVMILLKYETWQNQSPLPMAQAELPYLDNNSWHHLWLTFRDDEISAGFDGSRMIDVVDNSFDGVAPYESGGIGTHFYTGDMPYVISFSNLLVNVAPMAESDGYDLLEGSTLTVAAPGVLGNDAEGLGTNLSALLLSSPLHGTLSFSNSGAFSYTPAANFAGTDSFTYAAADSSGTSAPAPVMIIVTSNSPPVATDDSYSYVANSMLVVPPPGILANDTDANGFGLEPLLLSGPVHGLLVLGDDGGFSYTPATNFTGADSFTYAVTDGYATSRVATVSLSDPSAGLLFYDDFTRPLAPGSFGTWSVEAGEWSIAAGVLTGGQDTNGGYSDIFVPGNWSDFAVQAQMQFSDGAYAGGIGGRLNPTTGAHYAAWIYPSQNNLNLIRFQDWQTPVFLATTNLGVVGTNLHALKLAFEGDQIAVYYDGALVISTADSSAQALSLGGINVEMYTDANPYTMSVSNVIAEPLVLAKNYAALENTPLIFSAPGVLGNDTGVYNTNLSATWISGPQHGTVQLNTDGSFDYAPSAGFIGVDSFDYEASDGTTNLGAATVLIAVYSANSTAPVLPALNDVTVTELTPLTVSCTAYDPLNPLALISYRLENPPPGATINAAGVMSWTPSPAQSPGNYLIEVIATEVGVLPASATNSFTVQVNSIPLPPFQPNSGPVAVLTHHNDLGRTGANLHERSLNISNVNTNQFGLLFTRTVDDQIYAQPLLMTNVNMGALGTNNLVIVATVNDSVYAFDADHPEISVPYWEVSLLGPGELPPSWTDVGDCATFSGHLGIVSTPVIDPSSGTLYVVSRTKEFDTNFVQRLHALDIATGAERSDSPVVITASCPGSNSYDSVNGVVYFDPRQENQRAGLALVNGVVYICWTSHCDQDPYHGWVMGYDASTLRQVLVFNDTPDGGEGGIWMSGQAPGADEEGNLYLSLANGPMGNTTNPQTPGFRVESFLKLTPGSNGFTVASSFTPHNWQALDNGDLDLGGAGLLLIPGTTLAFSGGKQGVMYLVDRDDMGGLSSGNDDTNIFQSFQASLSEIHGGPVWWDGPDGSYAYVWPSLNHVQQYKFDRTNWIFQLPAYARGDAVISGGQPGGFLALSANGTNAGSGILWASQPVNMDAEIQTAPGMLRAYDAQNVAHELWNSGQVGARDAVGNFAKYVPPTVANGRVYLATFSNQLNVYGLLAPVSLNIVSANDAITLSWLTNVYQTFTLQCSTNLLSGNWMTMTNAPLSANGMFKVTVPATASGAFYRLKH